MIHIHTVLQPSRFHTTHFLDVENKVELANVFESLIQRLYEHLRMRISESSEEQSPTLAISVYLDEIKDAKLTLRRVDSKDEVQRRVVTIDEFGVLLAHEPVSARVRELHG